MLESPEGKAFTERYPSYGSSVLQDFGMARCCQVTLEYFTHNSTGTEGPGGSVQLIAHVSVSQDLSTRTVDNDTKLWCILSNVGWTVTGNIVQNLQPQLPDCWKTPRAYPTNQELIEIAKSTTVAKKYFTRFPDNEVTVHQDGDINTGYTVRFVPKNTETAEYATRIAGLDREVGDTHIVCSNGNYRYPTDPGFWSNFETSNSCLQSVHENLMMAMNTTQARDFLAKFPLVGPHSVDSTSQHTVTGTDSTIKFIYHGPEPYSPEATLVVHFNPGTHQIVNFEAQCGQEPSATGFNAYHTQNGANLDVVKFLQDSYCPKTSN